MIRLFFVCISLLLCTAACRQAQREGVGKDDFSNYEEPLIEVNKQLIERDNEIIRNFAERMQWDVEQTGSGLWYQIVASNQGDSVQIKDVISLSYRVSLLDGTICYEGTEQDPKSFVTGHGGVESGLEEGVLLLAYGDSARFILPPYLAHGIPGDGDKIPRRAIVVYEIKLLEANK